ncbi:MAG: DUF7347 domain-containing protein [Thermoprotei archaeon]
MSDKKDLYEILGSDVRRRIIVFVGERGSVRFTDLKNYMGISVGSLYYHLNILEGLITQTQDKRYTLTEKGLEAYKMLVGKNIEIPKQGVITRVLYGMMLSWLISKMSEKRSIRLPLILLLFTSYVYVPYTVRLVPLGFFFGFSSLVWWYYVVFSLLSWFLMYFFGDVLASLFFRRWGVGHSLLLELSVIPVFVLYVIPGFLFMLNLMNEYVLLVFQSWSLIILGFIIAYTKGLKVEQGLLITLILFYINFMLIYK